MSGPGIEGATGKGRIGPKVKGMIANPSEPKGPGIEQGDAVGLPSIKRSAGYKGLMNRLNTGR